MSFRLLPTYRVTYIYTLHEPPRQFTSVAEAETFVQPEPRQIEGEARVSQHELEAFLKVLIFNNATEIQVKNEKETLSA